METPVISQPSRPPRNNFGPGNSGRPVPLEQAPAPRLLPGPQRLTSSLAGGIGFTA